MFFLVFLVLNRGCEVPWAESILSFESSVKARIVTKATFSADVVGFFALGEKLTGYLESLLLYVTVNTGTYLTIKFVT